MVNRIRINCTLLAVSLILVACGGSLADEPATSLEVIDSATGAFTVQIPSGWEDVAGEDPRCGSSYFCRTDGDFILKIEEADVGDVDDLPTYIDLIMSDLITANEGAQLVSQSEATTEEGLPSVRMEVTLQDGLAHAYDQWVLSDGNILRVTYIGFADKFDRIRPTAEETFRTVAYVGEQ